MSRVAGRAIVLFGVVFGTVVAGWNDSSTGIDLNALPHFPLVKLRSGLFLHGTETTFDQIHATSVESANERAIVLRGSGVYGKRWEVHLSKLDEVWRGDLDGNGTQDYLFVAPGPYSNGRTAPPCSISILLMDRDAMPMPFFTTVYHCENGDSIKHVLDVQHDGHAALLISDYDENASDPLAIPTESGHWTHQLLRFNDLTAEDLRGVFAGIKFPLIHACSNRGKQNTADPESQKFPLQPPVIYDYSTSARRKAITTLRPGSDDLFLKTAPVTGCDTINAGPLVYDNSGTREIAFPSPFGDYRAKIAERIRRAGMSVELRGFSKVAGDGRCFANLVWAHKP